MATFTNSTFDDLLGQIPDPAVKDAYEEWEERGKDKLSPYKVTLDGNVVKAYGDLNFTDGQKSIDYETTYAGILSLKGKRRPKTLPLFFIIEYDFVNDNGAEMRQQVNDLGIIKKDRTAVTFSVSELEIEYQVTIETLRVKYRGARDIYIQAELMEVYDNASTD